MTEYSDLETEEFKKCWKIVMRRFAVSIFLLIVSAMTVLYISDRVQHQFRVITIAVGIGLIATMAFTYLRKLLICPACGQNVDSFALKTCEKCGLKLR